MTHHAGRVCARPVGPKTAATGTVELVRRLNKAPESFETRATRHRDTRERRRVSGFGHKIEDGGLVLQESIRDAGPSGASAPFFPSGTVLKSEFEGVAPPVPQTGPASSFRAAVE